MEITEVRIKLVENGNERLRAFCSVTLDGDFVVRDLKVIDGANGPFVAMPSRKLMDRCPRCSAKNHLRARFCNECGAKFNENRAPKDAQGRAKLHADVAHPINAACRERVQKAVVDAYQAELERAKSPDYKPANIDEYEDFEDMHVGEHGEHGEPAAKRPEPAPVKRPPEPREQPPAEKDDDTFGDYNALIEDLKREAQQRRGDRPERPAPVSEEEPVYQPPDAPPAPREQARRPEPKSVAPPPAAPSQQGRDDFGQGL